MVEELYSIMRDLLEVEYHHKSLLCVLETLETAYSERQEEEIKMILNHTLRCVKGLQEEMKAAVGRMDQYIAESVLKEK